ncbi:MAG TPA: SH3 domain-containing protein, partial [Aggregatilineales bacterium]|nr:SH3 domain-containing protein [Aggregatilineales bacterium]
MIKRIMIVMLLLLAAGLSALAQDGFKTSTNSRVNLRSGPGVEWRIVGTAQPNTTVLLDGQAYGGSWVRGITSTGVTGWIFAENLNISPDQAAGLPTVLVETPFSLSAPAQEGPIGGAVEAPASSA